MKKPKMNSTTNLYQNKESLNVSGNFIKLDGIREKLFNDRYALKNSQGEAVEKHVEQAWERIARALAVVEKTEAERERWGKKFYEAMADFKWVPAGRIFTGAGTEYDTTLINCFVVPSPVDSRKGVIETLGIVTEISAKGGGVGFNISSLRPRGTYIKTVNGTSSGAVSWAEPFSVMVHDIIQQGGTRRGALMIMLWDWHPDIEEFITVKQNQSKMLGANLSVCVSDALMKAVENDDNWDLVFPDTDFEKYRSEWTGDLALWRENGYPVKIVKTMRARELWDLICSSAWKSAEPGVVFMDTYNRMNNSYYFEKIISVNVCGEQGLPAWGVCNLGSINLAAFVKDDVSGQSRFDYEALSEIVKVAVRFMDNAIDAEDYSYDEIREVQTRERRTGIGTMGLADALIKLKIRYGSEGSLDTIEKIYKSIRDTAYLASVELAREKGSFPKFEADKFLKSGFMETMPADIRKEIRNHGIRNAFLLTQAPTGKISLLAGVSSGIEPVFSFSYQQIDRLGERTMYHPLYQEWVSKHQGEEVPDYFVVADDLSPDEHVKIQALIQKYTDSSISKTVNAPRSHTVDDVKRLYEAAYKTGCKGIAYFRDGSREATLVRNKEESKEVPQESAPPIEWERPMKVTGSTYKMKTPVGTAFITVNRNGEGLPFEIFINIGRAGSDIQAMAEALGRLISKSLKMDGRLSSKDRSLLIIDQLKGIGGMRPVGFGASRITSLPDAVAKVLAMDLGLAKETEVVKDESGVEGTETERETKEQLKLWKINSRIADICPDCGNASLVSEEGCRKCYGCGYSEC